jgi:hypothetical protein
MLAQGGQGLEHAAHLSGFEERDGGSFTFSSRTWEDREQVEEVSGVVRRDPATGVVSVRYAMPEPETQELPRGVLFPGQHLEQLLSAARAGERGLMRVVFDGSTSENPYQISHWIGDGQVAGSGAPQALQGLRAWPVRLAYFELGALEPSPDFQMSVEIFDNGVAGNQTFDYGDFAVDVTVEAVELLPTPECG